MQFGVRLARSAVYSMPKDALGVEVVKAVEILKQGQYAPLTVEMQIVHILAGDLGVCDELGDKVTDFIADLTSHFTANETALLTEIKEVATFKKNDLRERVENAIAAFAKNWS